jgi:F420-non-reducing hydrogenase small subunit
MWPIAHDGKYKDIEALPDGFLDLVFYNGAVRTSENEHVEAAAEEEQGDGGIRLLRAHRRDPCVGEPVLQGRDLREAYGKNPSIQEGNTVVPTPHTKVDAGELEIPVFYKRVYKLDDIVPVEYYIPGCPPAPEQVKAVIQLVLTGRSCRLRERGRRFRPGGLRRLPEEEG